LHPSFIFWIGIKQTVHSRMQILINKLRRY
jgi:hypothetical protein